jgi:RNA polymerase sigma-B factor
MTQEEDRRRFDEDLRAYAETRDKELRARLIASNLGLVEQLARRYANRGEPLDDLIQAGSIGLIKAIDRFDPTLGLGFGGYATKTIIGEIKRHFRDRGWSIRAPRRVQELYFELGRTIEELSHRNGRSPTLRELAEETQASEDAIVEALEAGHNYRPASLDSSDHDGVAFGKSVGCEDLHYSAIENHLALTNGLSELSERERMVIRLRFIKNLTLSEISERLGVSQMQVSRLLASAVSELHRSITNVGPHKRRTNS